MRPDTLRSPRTSPYARILARTLSATLALGLGMAAAQVGAPAHAPTAPLANQSMVRFVHTSPNVEADQVLLINGGQSVAIEQFTDIGYLEASDYVPVLAGAYDLRVQATSDDVDLTLATPDHRIDLIGGQYYTIVLAGLAIPAETTGVQDGFLAWLEDLFTADRRDLALRTIVIDDMTGAALAPGEAEVRIVHTAPGTAAVDLVHRWNGTIDVLDTVAYGETSSFQRFAPTTGRLEARIAGTDAVLVDLTEVAQDPGMVHTLFVTGTPVEDVPIEGLAVSTPWTAAMALPPGTPGGIAPTAGPATVHEVAWVRDHLVQVEAWLDTIEQRLTTTLADPAASDEQISAALQEIEQAMVLVAEARAQLDLVVPAATPVPTDPAAPAAPDEPAEPDDEDEGAEG